MALTCLTSAVTQPGSPAKTTIKPFIFQGFALIHLGFLILLLVLSKVNRQKKTCFHVRKENLENTDYHCNSRLMQARAEAEYKFKYKYDLIIP